MPKKLRSTSKPHTAIGLLRGAIGTDKPHLLSTALAEFKDHGPVEKFPFILTLAFTNLHTAQVFTPAKRVRELGKLGKPTVLSPTSLSREISWAADACLIANELIKQFIPLRDRFFLQLKSGLFDAALLTLDEIDDKCGFSLWSIENRICLLSDGPGGFEAQKKFVSQISKDHPRSNVAFMAGSIGERNEPRVTAKAFEQRLRHRSKSWEITESQISHIFYRLCNTIDRVEIAYASVIAHEGCYSAIDLYETLLTVTRRARHMPFFDQVSTLSAIEKLTDLGDQRVPTLVSFLGKVEISPINLSTAPTYYTNFRSGAFKESIKNAALALEENPWDVDAMVGIAKAQTAIGDAVNQSHLTGLTALLVPLLRSYFSGAADAELAVDGIIKSANNYRHADFSVPLILLLKSRTYHWFTRLSELRQLSNLFLSFSGSLFEFGPQSEMTSKEFACAAKLYSCILEGDLKSAQDAANALTDFASPYFHALGRSYSANILARNGEISASLEESVSALLDHPGMIDFTPLVDVLRPRGYRELKEMCGSPALSIAFYMFIESTEGVEKEVALKVAWKNYLQTLGVSKPSEYKPVRGYSRLERYFLSNVCIQSTMELGGAFRSQIDLDRERVAICANLATAFPSEADEYNREIVDLTRRINIEDGVELLESSRVYVDETGLQRWAKKNLESQFLRYLDHVKIGLVDSTRKLENDLIKISEAKSIVGQLVDYLDDYDITADHLLEGILRDLSQAFLQLPRYGLDSFLSSRIRHGSFIGYLRGPLEAHRLVTKRQANTVKYLDNDFMLDRWGISSEKDRRVVNSRLIVLSQAADDLLDEMVAKFLHVRSKTHPEGMIYLSSESTIGIALIKVWVFSLKARLQTIKSLDDLVSIALEEFLWPNVRPALDAVKMTIEGQLRSRFDGILESFRASVEGVTNTEQREKIGADIAATSTDLRDALRRVSLWFDLPKANTQLLSMPLDRVFEIGLASTRSARVSFQPDVEWKIEPGSNITVKGQAISALNDLAFLVFANISKHAGFEEPEPRPVKIYVHMRPENDGDIAITISNEISESQPLAEVLKRIADAREKIIACDIASVEKLAEGTGLLRLAIFFSEAGQNNFEFWYSEEDRLFHVYMRLPVGLVNIMRESSV